MHELKVVEDLKVDDLKTFPVWQYTNSDEEEVGETAVRPVKRTPVKTLNGRLVGTQVTLANGKKRWGTIEHVDESNPRLTQHFLTLAIFDRGRWFTMARYHDIDSGKRGPQALATFLRLPIDEVFPITYDIRPYCLGERDSLSGTIEKRPRERLTRAQVIALAVPTPRQPA
jgi:hypothetical protein